MKTNIGIVKSFISKKLSETFIKSGDIIKPRQRIEIIINNRIFRKIILCIIIITPLVLIYRYLTNEEIYVVYH
jgi:hypothetical protein